MEYRYIYWKIYGNNGYYGYEEDQFYVTIKNLGFHVDEFRKFKKEFV